MRDATGDEDHEKVVGRVERQVIKSAVKKMDALATGSKRPRASQASRTTARRRCYARAGIPLYLSIARDTAQVTLFSAPGANDYREHWTRPFGRELPLPDPFTFDLDTSDLL